VPDGRLPHPGAALADQCGKGGGTRQDEAIWRGFGYKATRATVWDGWPASAPRTHCWVDQEKLEFQVKVPPGTPGLLRLYFLDADNTGRKQRLFVQGKDQGEFAKFAGAGQWAKVKLTPADTKSGTVDVVIQNLNPATFAVVSTIEFVPDGW
jgi:hypothetical protein